jgi:hypothetical protein
VVLLTSLISFTRSWGTVVADAGQIPQKERIPKTTYATLAPIFFMASSRITDFLTRFRLKGPLPHQGVRVADFLSTSWENFDFTPYNEKELQSQRKIGAKPVEKVNCRLLWPRGGGAGLRP